MSYVVMSFAFAAIGFVAATTGASLLTVLLWQYLRGRSQRSGSLFLLRMLPAWSALFFVGGVVVPAFLLFEPRDTAEQAGLAVTAVIAVAVALVGAGLIRALMSWRATRRLERAWAMVARPGPNLGPAPVYRVPSEMPFAALVGLVRPRPFVADRFFDSLESSEQLAVIQHETGHLLARDDNLKRMAMRMAPDWLAFTETGREIEAAWAVAAEEAADDHAAGTDRARALDLASALLKAARHRPLRCFAVANFCDGATIAGRTARLLAGAPARLGSTLSSHARLLRAAVLLGLIALFIGPVCSATYRVLEASIRLLR